MKTATGKYQPLEILQIIQANYIQDQQLDNMVFKGQDLTLETTISDWRDICDLVDTTELWKYLDQYFYLAVDREIWMTILEPDDEKTLGDLCHFIANNAEKEMIRPIILFGNQCNTAAIFKSLKRRLEKRGVDVSDFRPSSELEPIVKKYRSVVIEEINQFSPSVLPPIDYKTNWVYKWGLRLLITFLFVTIFLAWKKISWGWMTGGLCLIGYSMMGLGVRLDPKRAKFNDIYTVADLVRKIDQQQRPIGNGL